MAAERRMRDMRPLHFAAALAIAMLVSSVPARADDGIGWRRTTPRALVTPEGDTLELRVPTGRAWGVTSRALPVDPALRYRAAVDLVVPADGVRGAFLRLALYGRPDGRGRQRLRVDSPLGGSGTREIEFVPPAWARSVKLRVLVRAAAEMTVPVRLSGAGLAPVRVDRPEVVLRPDD